MKKILILSLSVLTLVALYLVNVYVRTDEDFTERPHLGNVYDETPYDHVTYREYRQMHPEVFPSDSVMIDVTDDFTFANGLFGQEAYTDDFTDDDGDRRFGLYVPESGDISFNVNIVTSGYYHISLDYLNIQGRSASISRGLLINGDVPFREAANLSFSRIWRDAFNVTEARDDTQNDLKPAQREVHLWQNQPLIDVHGFYNVPFAFYLEEGVNVLTLVSHREPMVIDKIHLYQEPPLATYADRKTEYEANQYQRIDEPLTIKTQGEDADRKSSPTLAPAANFSNHKVEPFDSKLLRYNTIGGIHWRISGDWIAWDVEVPETGLYRLTFKVLQNYNRGMTSSRTLRINGEVPFEEALIVEFPYDSDWQYVTVGNHDEDFYIYLEEGMNEISLEANIGRYGPVVQSVEETISLLRSLYRDVVRRTGLNPDPFQDYLLTRYVDDLDVRIEQAIINLENARFDVVKIAGERSGLISTFDRTVFQLKRFLNNEKNIQMGLSEFEQNIAGLGAWVMNMSEQPLAIDYFLIHDTETELRSPKLNFFQKFWHELVMFFESFGARDSFASSVEVEGPTITVWIMTGRDQAIIIRQLIDELFTVEHEINVDLKLVTSAVLLPATLSGNGPDVAIGVGENLPVNWGIRNAIVDLSQFDDFEAVAARYHDSAMFPYTFAGKTYALPDTQEFLVSFYRDDVLADVGIDTMPQTWDDVIDMLPMLQKNYLDFYIPNTRAVLNPVLHAMIEQHGGSLYINQGQESGLLLEESTRAFVNFTQLYTNYSFVLDANFVNRFRSGEMPIGVSYFTDYNTLSVFAPEINGLWSYGPIPGLRSDEGLNNTTSSRTTGTIILEDSNKKEASWEFMKWWLGAEAQLNYARNMEAILGAAARYPTANLEAFEELPWPLRDYMVLSEQRHNAKGIPVVPGDYIVGRYIDNAFRSSLNHNISPYDTLFVYHRKINIEIERKRAEFGL